MSPRVCVNVCGVLEISVASIVTCNLNWIPSVNALAIFSVMVAHQWTFGEFDAALTIEVAFMNGVVL